MQLTKLSLCLLGLSLSACSSHIVKNNTLNANQDASQRAVQGFNALYDYPNFDYRGQVKIKISETQKDQKKGKDQAVRQLDSELEKKLDQYLKQQKIQLTDPQKKQLFQSLAKQESRYLSDLFGQGADVFQSILNDVQIHYDGTVNYRQKMASFNLETQYKKPNLSVEMRIPTILDLNEYKFYTQIFSLMPYLANAQDQDKYAYYDFSKYKNEISRVHAKALIEFLKQSGATTYVLSPKDQIETIKITSAEQQAGVVEKIRLNTSIEEVLLQARLYASVNRQYFMNSVLGLNPSTLAKLLDESETAKMTEKQSSSSATVEATQAVAQALDDTGTEDAASAMYKLYDAVNREVYGASGQPDAAKDQEASKVATDSDEADPSVEDEGVKQAHDKDESASADAESIASEKILTEQQCQDLTQTQSQVRFGDVEYCQYHYEVDLLNSAAKQDSPLAVKTDKKDAELAEKFVSLGNQEQLVDANQFKQLWDQHRAEVEASLPSKHQRNSMIVDIGLDQQGRAVKMDYDLGMDFGKLNRKLNLQFDMQFLNYGNATKIDRKTLNEAKSFKEIFKSSLMGRAIGGFAQDSSSTADQSESSYVSLDEQLENLATQVFIQTGAYDKTYKAVFIAQLTAEKPELVKQYSAQDLQEIAAVYAYSYSDEAIYNPKGKVLQQIEALKKKHHLEDDHQYDDDLGNSIDKIVAKIWKEKQSVLEIQKLQQQYKTAEAVFAQYYMQKFEAENEIEPHQRAEFLKTVNTLSKAYTAFKHNKFNDHLVANLNEDSVEFIDYDLFKKTYQVLSDSKL